MKPMEANVELVWNCSQPQTKNQVSIFLGLFCYYFLYRSGTLLTELTKKNEENKVIWNRACEKAFNNLLEQALISQPF